MSSDQETTTPTPVPQPSQQPTASDNQVSTPIPQPLQEQTSPNNPVPTPTLQPTQTTVAPTNRVSSPIPQPSPPQIDLHHAEAINLILAEYATLRAEIMRLSDTQFQLTTFTIISLGTMLSISVSNKSASLILIYPILALLLFICWLNRAQGIARLGRYIKNKIEIKVGIQYLGWENSVERGRRSPMDRFSDWEYRIIFIGSEILAGVAGFLLTNAKFSTIDIVLLIVDFLCILASIIFFIIRHEDSKENNSSNISSYPNTSHKTS